MNERKAISLRVGERLRALRVAAGLTQQQVAERTSKHRPLVCRLEKGVHQQRLDQILAFARAVGVKPSEILMVLDEPIVLDETDRRMIADCSDPSDGDF